MNAHPAMRGLLVTVAILAASVASFASAGAEAKVKIVASTTDLGSIASSVGGDNVEVVPICKPNADPHHVEVLPSYMVRASRARLYLKVGLGLDQWADLIVDGSHNSNLTMVDCSKGVKVLERPVGRVDASMGDVHPDGNPHYWLDPMNGAIVAHNIADALGSVDPAHASDYESRAVEFDKATQAMLARGKQITGQMDSKNIVTYHRSWSYLGDAFGLDIVGTVEPIPGIPPTGKHLNELVSIIKTQKGSVLLQEPYFSDDAGKFLNRETGIRVVTKSAASEDVAAGSYLRHLEDVLTALAGATTGPAGSSGR